MEEKLRSQSSSTLREISERNSSNVSAQPKVTNSHLLHHHGCHHHHYQQWAFKMMPIDLLGLLYLYVEIQKKNQLSWAINKVIMVSGILIYSFLSGGIHTLSQVCRQNPGYRWQLHEGEARGWKQNWLMWKFKKHNIKTGGAKRINWCEIATALKIKFLNDNHKIKDLLISEIVKELKGFFSQI